MTSDKVHPYYLERKALPNGSSFSVSCTVSGSPWPLFLIKGRTWLACLRRGASS